MRVQSLIAGRRLSIPMTSVRWSVLRIGRNSPPMTGLTLKEGSEAIRGYFARLAKSGDKVVIGDRKIIVLDDNVSTRPGSMNSAQFETAR